MSKKHLRVNGKFQQLDPTSILIIVIIIFVGILLIYKSLAATSTANIEPEDGSLSSNIQQVSDVTSSSGGYVKFKNSATSGTWVWPATLNNTGPVAGTLFANMAPRRFDSSDNGKTFENFQMNITAKDQFLVTGSNITFRNCKIIYTNTVEDNDAFFKLSGAKNINFDHCLIDPKGYHEYGLHARNSSFTVQYSQLKGASHLINSNGDSQNGVVNIYRNHMTDWSDKPYRAPGVDVGHNNIIYIIGGSFNIEDNTIVGPRYERCDNGWSNGPGPSCLETEGTSAVTAYANEAEGGIATKDITIKHNQISAAAYSNIRFYGDASHQVESVQIINNVYTAQSGMPKSTFDGGLYVFSNIGTVPALSGNTWGSDTVCFTTPNSCSGKPNTFP